MTQTSMMWTKFGHQSIVQIVTIWNGIQLSLNEVTVYEFIYRFPILLIDTIKTKFWIDSLRNRSFNFSKRNSFVLLENDYRAMAINFDMIMTLIDHFLIEQKKKRKGDYHFWCNVWTIRWMFMRESKEKEIDRNCEFMSTSSTINLDHNRWMTIVVLTLCQKKLFCWHKFVFGIVRLVCQPFIDFDELVQFSTNPFRTYCFKTGVFIAFTYFILVVVVVFVLVVPI